MGKRDSSITRVAPVFSFLLERDPTGLSWLAPLLTLPSLNERRANTTRVGELEKCAWHGRPQEMRLDPPVGLLSVLVGRLFRSGNRDANPKRQALFDGDVDAVAEAMSLIERHGFVKRAWWVFEGQTSVDAYLQTSDLIVVIEGKRTERVPTESTRWMPARSQMLRNLDAAWEIRGTREVVGFYLVEGDPPDKRLVPKRWEDAARATIEPLQLAASLPHRREDEQAMIAAGFLGVATWDGLCEALDIPRSVLLDEVAGRG